MSTRDGRSWMPGAGPEADLPCVAAITPSCNVERHTSPEPFDAIVIGAGYAGLIAARDLTTSGLKVLLLDGRDRLGGRAWSTDLDGHPFEMGGSYVSDVHRHVWREITRYQLGVKAGPERKDEQNKAILIRDGEERHASQDERNRLLRSAVMKIFNVDGAYGKLVMPTPLDEAALTVENRTAYDDMSIADRLAQLGDGLSADETAVVSSFVVMCTGSRAMDECSFYELLHWWCLCGHSPDAFFRNIGVYQLRRGQSSLARCIFDDALGSGRLAYALGTPVDAVRDGPDAATVRAGAGGRAFRARRVVCTVPLNTLRRIAFDPPLPADKLAAADTNRRNGGAKINSRCAGADLRSWTCSDPDNGLICYSYESGSAAAGTTNIVGFGQYPEGELDDAAVGERFGASIHESLRPHVKQIVFHNWSRDEYSNGSWFFPGPGLVTRYLDGLRRDHGNVLFASSDWSTGWRGFIDGAMQEGARAAAGIVKSLRVERL
ncbi:hypothetical protein CDD83_3716 [Cordyceps sp. RAO-2017]|nr:hypothetical protein CDD83_3716 [Cordyceps sp. RAO-2017]